MRQKNEIRLEAFKARGDAINRILHHVNMAENEVRESAGNRYWKASETLYRLTLSIYDTTAALDRHIQALTQEMAEVVEAENREKEPADKPAVGLVSNTKSRIQENIENREFREAQAWAND